MLDSSLQLAVLRGTRDELRAARDRLAARTATADSPDGLISATMSGRGELRDLWLDSRALRDQDSRALAAAIAATINAAAADATR